MHHVCPDPGPNGCCNDREDSVVKACGILDDCFIKPMSIPALNKWTKVYPSFGQTVILFQFHDVVPRAIKARLGSAAGPVDESSSDEEEKKLGVPLNETKRWRKLARKRNQKASAFLNDSQAKWLCLIWLAIVHPIMSLHWKLF